MLFVLHTCLPSGSCYLYQRHLPSHLGISRYLLRFFLHCAVEWLSRYNPSQSCPSAIHSLNYTLNSIFLNRQSSHSTISTSLKMQFSSVLLFVSSVSALGINCRGSFMCNANPGASLQQVRDQVGNMIAQGGGDRRFNSGRKFSWYLFFLIVNTNHINLQSNWLAPTDLRAASVPFTRTVLLALPVMPTDSSSSFLTMAVVAVAAFLPSLAMMCPRASWRSTMSVRLVARVHATAKYF